VAAVQASQDVTRRAVAAVCALSDPCLTPLLLSWLLREDSRLGIVPLRREEHTAHDVAIERMVIALPLHATNDARVHAALKCSRSVRGDIMSRLLHIRASENRAASLVQAVRGLSFRHAVVLVWFYVFVEGPVNRWF
jgi:hypothetical protein